VSETLVVSNNVGLAHGSADRGRQVANSRRKRVADVILASIGILVLSPVFAVIALGILMDSGRPIFYRQRRIAFDRRRGARRNPRERTFVCWKFRTMVQDAEALQAELAARNVAPFPAFKVQGDPRITRIGRFLRRSSLDELPQLWNVLRGEMSLVGPRPPLPEEVAKYDDFALQRLAVRPGITCVWQISHRHKRSASFGEWVEQDIEYIRTWSPMADLALICKTVVVVFKLTGD
jgi:lipopolysaccharide/colanic/teichoic acid biosynthesis glycosyltransferase